MKARDNPFRSERVDALGYRSPEFSWEELEARLRLSGGRGAIIGAEGHGKTTLLTQWAERRKAKGDRVVLLRILEAQRRMTDGQREQLSLGGWVFVDSAEQLGWLGWRELRKLAAPAEALIVTTHQAGRLAMIFKCRTSPELLSELVKELDGAHGECAELWHRHRGNVRLALRELYDRCAVGNRKDQTDRSDRTNRTDLMLRS
jgi:hypothetical protein